MLISRVARNFRTYREWKRKFAKDAAD